MHMHQTALTSEVLRSSWIQLDWALRTRWSDQGWGTSSECTVSVMVALFARAELQFLRVSSCELSLDGDPVQRLTSRLDPV